MDKLKELESLVKFNYNLEMNPHKEDFKSVTEYFDELKELFSYDLDIEPDTMKGMIDNDRIYCFRVYPDNSVGFYEIYDYDIDKIMDRMIEAIKAD